jgi:hypothetical protein
VLGDLEPVPLLQEARTEIVHVERAVAHDGIRNLDGYGDDEVAAERPASRFEVEASRGAAACAVVRLPVGLEARGEPLAQPEVEQLTVGCARDEPEDVDAVRQRP